MEVAWELAFEMEFVLTPQAGGWANARRGS
jgi:hypothetical protein